MQLSNLPARIQQAFAVAGLKNTIPQTTVVPGAASFNQGFPALTMTALNAGGVPPAGQDFNGILNAITLLEQWQSAGGSFPYDATWSTANNGYPKGAVLLRADGTGFWFNTVDNNTADPDGATPTGWVPEWQNGITSVTGLTNANVTLTSLQYGRSVITLTGTLTGNVQIIVPAIAGAQWLVLNGTTGAFTATVKTAAGSGPAIPQGGSLQVWCDGGGINAVGSGTGGIRQVFLSGSGSWTVPATVSIILAEVWGGGGGGGGTGSGSNGTASGGGGGGYTWQIIGVIPGSSLAYSVGAAGASGGAGGAGGAGGSTSFAGTLGANGGGGGSANSITTGGAGGTASGGAPSTGTGGGGGMSASQIGMGGTGGSPSFGGVGCPGSSGSAGPGGFPGGGGGGSGSTGSTTGGAGGAGSIRITYVL